MRLCAGLMLVASALAVPANAQGPASDKINTVPDFLDKTIPRIMEEQHVAGAAVAVVAGDRSIYLRGFGDAILDSRRPVDPAGTAFRIGSVSKLFTAIAALQLVDEGKLDLQRDIRAYLPELTLQAPTTMHQLLTHTAGLDERFAGAYTESTVLPSLSEHLRLHPPQQVITPGTGYSYSNYNFAVAGAVIEAVSRQRYEQYVAERVFAPLQMRSTTAYQPPPGDLAAKVARGYRWTGDRQEALPARYTFSSPSGGVTTSAADMSRVLRALLAEGTIEGVRILSPVSVRMLVASQYTPHPRIPAAAYGWLHWQTRGRELLFKDGTLGDQVGVVILDPAGQLGIFLASNALPGIEVLVGPLMTHLYGPPIAPAAPVPLPNAAQRQARYAGVYRDFHHTRNDLSRLRALMPMIQTRVSANPDSSLQWKGRRWVEVEPLLFQSADGGDYMVMRQDTNGDPVELHAWGGTYQRIGFFEQAPFHIAVFLACVLASAIYLVTLLRGRRVGTPPGANRAARYAGAFLSLVNITFAGGLIVLFMDLGASVPLPLPTKLWLALPMVALVLTVLVVPLVGAAWRSDWWRFRERVSYSAMVAASIAFMVFLNYWKLLGFNY
jgi:CubicO group peptidase (beta-lactamase class C family)